MVSTGAAVRAQAPAAQTATQFYLSYRAAFDKATKIDDVLPYMAAEQVKMVADTPADQRAKMFEFIKMMGALTDVKVLKEQRTANGATLTAEGIGPDQKKQTGQIEIVREKGAWKLGKESWKN
jgi:hypothetical protein